MELRRRFSARTYIVLAIALQLATAVFGVSALLRPAATDAAQTIPYKINFQGRLTDNSGNVLSDGAYNIKFRFFDAATVGVNKWQGDRVYGVSDNRVTVQNGLFNIQFGDTTKGDPVLTPALFNTVANGNLWLEVELPTPATATCATNGCAVFTEGAMTPRQPLASSPYAFNADLIDGIDGASLVQLTPSSQQTGTINVSGSVTSGGTLQGNTVDAATSGVLTLGASNATSVSLAKNTTLASGLTMTLQGNNALTLGSTTNAGGIVFQDGTVNNRTVTLSAPALGASYNLSLPNAAPSTDQCLKSGPVTAANLAWATCGATLQDAYASSSTPAQITTTSGTKDVIIKSGVGFNSTTAFRVVPDGTTTPTLNVDTTNNRVGVGTAAPLEALNVNGAIKLGTTAGANAGTIRYSGTDFEGYDGASWLSLTNGGMVQTTPTVAKRKTTADTSLANTTTLTQENDLSLTVGANESWVVRYSVHVSVNTAPDFKFQINAPAGATCRIAMLDVEETAVTPNLTCGASTAYTVPTTDQVTYEFLVTVANGATPGTVGFLWAPNVSNAAATILRQNSTMNATRASGGTAPFQAYIQGGNSFAATAQLGTNDAQDLSLITGGVEAARLNTAGDLTVAGGLSIGAAEVYAINGVQITSAALSNDAAITKQGNTFNGTTQLVQTTAGGAYPALSGAAITGLNPTNLATGSGAVTLQSAAASALTITAGSGTIGLGSATLQRAAAALTIDVANATASTLNILNSNGANVANVDVDGGINIGTGQTYKVGSTAGAAATCSGGQVLTNPTVIGGITTAGTCAVPSGSGANTALSNLTTTAVNQSLLSAATNTLSLGSAANIWQNVYTGNLSSGTASLNSAAYATNQFAITNGLSSTIPTVPNAYVATQIVRVNQTSGSRPMFFGYDDGTGTGWAANVNMGACGAFTQMCLNFGSGATDNTALYNAGTTLGVGGGPDGNFTDVLFGNTGTVSLGAATALTATGAVTVQAGGTAQNINLTPSTTGKVVIGGTAPGITSNGATALTVDTGGAAGLTLAGTNANALTLGRAGLAASIPGGLTTGGAAINAGTGTITGNGSGLTNLNPTNLVQGTGAVTLQPAAAQNLTLTTTGASGLIVNPGTAGVTTNLPAGVQAKFTATATPTADLLVIGNIAGQEPTGNTINGLQLNWFARPATGNMSSGQRIDIRNNNTVTAGQVQGVRIVATGAGGAINSDTAGLYIDALTNASTGAAGENAIEVGAGWDAGMLIQSGGNLFSSTTTDSTVTVSQSGNPGAGAATLLIRNANGTPSGNLLALNNNTANVLSISATGSASFQPTVDSQTALVVTRSAAGGGTRLFAVDSESTTDPVGVQVGSGTADAVQVDFGLDSSNVFADAGTCTTTSNQGALYYNAAASSATQAGSNAVRACTNGAWEDLVSTAGLGILAYGVVPDSGANPGDLPSIVTASVSGPCKVSWVANAATSTVRIEACTAYSGGRKVTIQQNTTFAVPTNVANGYSHICLGATGGITATASNATETANLPALSVGAPVLCLADVRANATANGIQAIYDTRAFTTSAKEFVNTAAATPLGVVVVANGTGVGLPAGATVSARGIVVATNGAASVANAPNAIIAVSGPTVAKSNAATASNFVNIGANTGYVVTAAAASGTAYANLGYARNNFPGVLCTATPNATNCNRSIFFNLSLR